MVNNPNGIRTLKIWNIMWNNVNNYLKCLVDIHLNFYIYEKLYYVKLFVAREEVFFKVL